MNALTPPPHPIARRASPRYLYDRRIEADAAVYRHIVENAADLIIRGDAARKRTYVSPSAREILGYEPAELLGGHAYDLLHPDDAEHVATIFAQVGPALPSASLTFRMRRKDGTYIWIDGSYRYLLEDGGVLGILRDITQRKQAEDLLFEANAKLAAANELLGKLANQDGLTRLHNRRRFDALLDDEFRRARRYDLPLGLVLLDVDCFKLFNDRYGHLAGDECLMRISLVVMGNLLRPGDAAARHGGEEIAVLLPVASLRGALDVGERLRRAIAMLRVEHAGSPHGIVTVSAGVASILPIRPDADPADLVDAADRALYRAKEAGRNKVRGASPLDEPRVPAT